MRTLNRCSRSTLSVVLNSLALCFSVSAFCTNYWCEGTHKVVKPPCMSAMRNKKCIINNVTTEGNGTGNYNAVQYIWETGDDKYTFRYFHTGFWLSCEDHQGEDHCRSFIELAPASEKTVLWMSIVAEFLYIILLSLGLLLMSLELLCFTNAMGGLKISAFAAVLTVLSGLLCMVANMMYMTVFQVTVNLGPKDWRPQSWDYGWSFGFAWLSFTLCMSASVLTLNSYTKTVLEFKYRRRLIERTLQSSEDFADAELAKFLWKKYVFSISGSQDGIKGHIPEGQRGSGSSVFVDIGSLRESHDLEDSEEEGDEQC
ncbi:germ cell-specific gene 1-like protein [Protopterus annectens]|uniref:germ cell-specific gene 1-like protein n=1 Tax=Protopterus annectens TaxID=7888 RepID=UPI001CF948E1|nr:germ cell-specific gene 1-like protein [Protopterus annectens]